VCEVVGVSEQGRTGRARGTRRAPGSAPARRRPWPPTAHCAASWRGSPTATHGLRRA